MSCAFVWGPATFVVMLVVGVLLVAGALILGGSRRRRQQSKDSHACSQCGGANSENAQYCARCGHELPRS